MSTWHDSKSSDPLEIRVSIIEDELAQAEMVDLATASNAELVLLVEKLRSSIAEALRIIRQPPVEPT